MFRRPWPRTEACSNTWRSTPSARTESGASAITCGLRRPRHMSVSVVVVAYGAGPALERCLDSIRGECDEIVVVDNKGDAVVPDDVRLISPEENLGFAGGANLGAGEASGDVVMFLNPDAGLVPGAARRLAEVLS